MRICDFTTNANFFHRNNYLFFGRVWRYRNCNFSLYTYIHTYIPIYNWLFPRDVDCLGCYAISWIFDLIKTTQLCFWTSEIFPKDDIIRYALVWNLIISIYMIYISFECCFSTNSRVMEIARFEIVNAISATCESSMSFSPVWCLRILLYQFDGTFSS